MVNQHRSYDEKRTTAHSLTPNSRRNWTGVFIARKNLSEACPATARRRISSWLRKSVRNRIIAAPQPHHGIEPARLDLRRGLPGLLLHEGVLAADV